MTNTLHPSFSEYTTESGLQSDVGSHGKDGQLNLVFKMTSDRTRLMHDFAQGPFHISGEVGSDPHDKCSSVCIQSSSGGVVQGDRRNINIEVQEDAVAHVGTQSATNVHSMASNYASTTTELKVDSNGHLDYFPEPTILYSNSRYHQSTELLLKKGATAIIGDVVVPGRLSRGEWFDFDRYYSSLECRGPDGLLFATKENYGPNDDPTNSAVLNEYSVYGCLFVGVPSADPTEIYDWADKSTDVDVLVETTSLPNEAGVVVRALGHQSYQVTNALRAAWKPARESAISASPPDNKTY